MATEERGGYPGKNRHGGATLRAEVAKMLPTPTAREANGAGGEERREGGPSLRTEVAKLLPTPTTAESTGPQARGNGRLSGQSLRVEIARLLPTPRARDAKGRAPNTRGVDLNEAVAILPDLPNQSDRPPSGAPTPER